MAERVARFTATQNKRKGADFEIAIVEYLRSKGENVERLRLAGTYDEGDLAVFEPDGYVTVVEAKNAKLEPSSFVQQAHSEASNFAKKRGLDQSKVDGVAIVKRRGKGVGDAFVITTVDRYFDL